ncbi:MAG: winged helix-turn-helix domain-containing protein [Muribaculaceae bacterium]
MNTDTIGMNAGLVWNALNDAQAMGLKQLKKVTKLKEKEMFAAIGWLAREDKINIQADDKDPKELILSLVQGK